MAVISLRIYYEDTDAGGIVYYANYLKFCERGRTELLRSLGFENKSLMDREGLLFVVRRIEADYLAPARLDDLVEVHTSIGETGGTRFVMRQSVRREGKTLFEMDVTLVCVGLDGKPKRLPETLARTLNQAE